jgi:hypothetical protein
VNFTACPSTRNRCLYRKYSAWRIVSPSTSSTNTQNATDLPCDFTSTGNSVLSTTHLKRWPFYRLNRNRQAHFGNWWINLCSFLPNFGTRINYPCSTVWARKTARNFSQRNNKALLLNLLHHFLRELIELCKGTHTLPHPTVDHLRERERILHQKKTQLRDNTVLIIERTWRPADWVTYTMFAIRAEPSTLNCEMYGWRRMDTFMEHGTWSFPPCSPWSGCAPVTLKLQVSTRTIRFRN